MAYLSAKFRAQPGFIGLLITMALLMVLSGCTQRSRSSFAEQNLSPSESANLIIYRPQQFFHMSNPEGPFVFVGEQNIGALLVGGVLQHRVKPGKYVVKLRQSILFMPAYEIGNLEIEAEAGKTYFFRYAYDMTGIIGTYPQGASSFFQVNEETGWKFK